MPTLTILENNNPGAIIDGSYARSQPGYVPGGGKFAKFQTPEHGIAAQENLLRTSSLYRGRSVNQIVNTYAPPRENSAASRTNYIAHVASSIGIDPNQPVPPDKVGAMARAMREFERGAGGHGSGGSSGGGSSSQIALRIPAMPPDHLNNPTPASRGKPLYQTSADALLNGITDENYQTQATQAPAGGVPRTEQNPVADVFAMAPGMAAAADKVTGRLSAQDQFLDALDEKYQTIQDTRRARIEHSVEQKRVINDTVGAETQSMIDRAAPIMQRRAALAAQLYNLSQMDPLSRGFKGIFNLNYNQHYLEEQAQQTEQALHMMGQDYEYMTGLREKLSQVVDNADTNQGRLENVTMAELDEDGKILAAQVSSANQQFQFLTDQVGANENLVRAQQASAEKLLSDLAPADLQSLMVEAQNAPGGTIVHDGVELHFGELRQRVMAQRTQDMSFRGQQIALERGETELSDYHAQQWAQNATESQLRAAIAANGNYNGMQVPIPVLTEQLGNRVQYQEFQTQEILRGNPTVQLQQDLLSFGPELNVINSRVKSLFGGATPPEIAGAAQQVTAQMQLLQTKIADAQRRGVTPQVSAQLRQDVAALRQNFLKTVDQVATRQSDGDKRAASWMSIYLRGGHLDENQSAEALAYYAERGSLPQGMRSSPQARAAFTAARSAIATVDAKIEAGTKMNADQRRQAITREIQTRGGSAYTQISFNQMIDAIPDIAERTNDAFRGVSRSDFQTARRAGEQQGYVEIARTLGVGVDAARQLFAGTYTGPKAQQLEARIRDENLSGTLVSRQQSVFLDTLDHSNSAREGFRPSRALADMLAKPTFHNMATQYERAAGSMSYGDFLGAGTTPGQLTSKLDQWARQIHQGATDLLVAENADGRFRNMYYHGMPMERAKVVFAAIPGIEQADENALLRALEPHYKRAVQPANSLDPNFNTNQRPSDGQMTGYARTSDMQTFRQVLMGTKFQDPNLERIRQIAAKHYDEIGAMTDRAVDRAFERR